MFKVALKTSQTRANYFTTTNIENVPFNGLYFSHHYTYYKLKSFTCWTSVGSFHVLSLLWFHGDTLFCSVSDGKSCFSVRKSISTSKRHAEHPFAGRNHGLLPMDSTWWLKFLNTLMPENLYISFIIS